MESNSTAFLIKIKLRHSLGRPSRSDFVQSEFAFVGCFGFYAGKPDMEIVRKKPEGFKIMVPQNKEPLVI